MRIKADFNNELSLTIGFITDIVELDNALKQIRDRAIKEGFVN